MMDRVFCPKSQVLDIARSDLNKCPGVHEPSLEDHEFSRIAIWSEQ
jgi:hypothetical protein